MSDLSKYSDDDLRNELENRKVKGRMKKPLEPTEIDWSSVIESVTDGVDAAARGRDSDDPKVWDWYNKL